MTNEVDVITALPRPTARFSDSIRVVGAALGVTAEGTKAIDEAGAFIRRHTTHSKENQ
jgi:hypothetical protein